MIYDNAGNRPWPLQRHTRFKNRRRAPIEKRYHPPRFDVKKGLYYAKDSVFGYLLAKGIYWHERYGEPVVVENQDSLIYRLQG